MEKMEKENKVVIFISRYATCSAVLVFSTAAFSCCFTAEFNKVKARDMKVDGSLCSLPKSTSFGLGIAAITCLSITQIVATIIGASRILSRKDKSKMDKITSICFLVFSWLIYGLMIVMLATATSMNRGQEYGKGWMDGECYLVKKGVFGGAAALVIVNAVLMFGFTSMHPHHRPFQPSVNTSFCRQNSIL